MADADKEGKREQNNYGSGPFIGGHNYGDIRMEMLDSKTKGTLAKLSKDAPALAGLLETALKDGIISPDTVSALQSAVRNINEDVAYSLRYAAQNINEDVAHTLSFAAQNINEDVAYKLSSAGENINEDVANRIARAADQLGEATNDLDRVSHSLERAIGQARILRDGIASAHPIISASVDSYAPDEIEDADPYYHSGRLVHWWTKFKIFAWGFGIGAVAGGVFFYYVSRH
jgi:hypothetical protein